MRARRPEPLASTTSSPSASPRCAASAGCTATVAAPMRRASLRSLAKESLRIQGEAGVSSRSRPGPGRGSACGSGDAGEPVGGRALARQLDAPAGRREAQVGELDLRLVGRPDRAGRGERREVDARRGEERRDDLRVGLVQLGLLEAHRGGEPAEDLGVGQRVSGRLHGLHLRAEAEVEVGGDDVVAFEEARRRQHDVGEVGGVGREEVDRDGEEVLARERGVQAGLLGVRRGDVDVPAEEGAAARARSPSRSTRSMWLTGSGIVGPRSDTPAT